MDGLDVTYPAAFFAGLLSFISPCVLPLVPPYLCFLGGVSAAQLQDGAAIDRAASGRVIASAGAFVLGFTTVFVAMGATASIVGDLVSEYFELLGILAGSVIILLGLHFVGAFRIPLLFREARFHVERRPAGLVGAYAIGLAFAFGWTPCVGPVLAAILFVAGSEPSVGYGASLLAVYSLGIGLPFFAAALASPWFLSVMSRFRRYMPWVERVMGALLIATGILFLTGGINDIGYWLLETFPGLGMVG